MGVELTSQPEAGPFDGLRVMRDQWIELRLPEPRQLLRMPWAPFLDVLLDVSRAPYAVGGRLRVLAITPSSHEIEIAAVTVATSAPVLLRAQAGCKEYAITFHPGSPPLLSGGRAPEIYVCATAYAAAR